jgi:hypothetical protein
MSENTGANAQSTPANAEGGAGDMHEDTEQPSTADVNSRLLRESREWKAKYQALKHEREEAEKRRLESQQEWKTLAEKLSSENKSLKDSFVREKIRASVHDKALRAGCINVEDLLKVGNTGLLQVDEETYQVQGTEVFVEEAKRLKPYLFQQSKNSGKTSTINSVTPGGVPEKRISANEVASMKPSDPRKQAAWFEAIKAKQ